MLLNWFYFSKFIFGVMRCGHRHWDHHLIFIQVLLIRFLSSLFEQKPYTMAWIFIKKLPLLMIHSKEINAKKTILRVIKNLVPVEFSVLSVCSLRHFLRLNCWKKSEVCATKPLQPTYGLRPWLSSCDFRENKEMLKA